jgi:aconitate decarboxylase
VTNAEVMGLRDRVSITADASMNADEAHLSLTHQLGSVERHVAHAVGSSEVPMTDEQLERKFLDQVSPILGKSMSTQASEAAWALGDAEDVLPLMRHFCRRYIVPEIDLCT